MSNPDSFIDEVTEAVRRDRLFAAFRKYGWIGALLVVLVVGGTGWREYSSARDAASAQAFGDALLDALDLGEESARAAALAEVPATGSQKALKASQTATMRRAFFEFSDQLKNNETGYFPYTPPVQLLHALRASLDQMMAEGLDNVIARHRRLGAGVRAAVKAWGMDLCAESPAHYSDTVTAIRTPDGVDARDVIRIGYDRYNASFGSGLGPLAGKVFRIGHIGHCNEGMCLTAIALAELSMAAAGAKITFGSGVAAAQEVYASATIEAARIAAE